MRKMLFAVILVLVLAGLPGFASANCTNPTAESSTFIYCSHAVTLRDTFMIARFGQEVFRMTKDDQREIQLLGDIIQHM